MKSFWNWQSLTFQVLFALALGAIVGLTINLLGGSQISFFQNILISGVFEIGGQAFLRLLQFLVVPVVVVSLICGTAGLGDVKKLGRIGGKAIGLYLITTALAITLGLIAAAVFINPGEGFDLQANSPVQGDLATAAPSLSEMFIGLFPKNPIEAMAKGEMLQIIFFSVLFGVALTLSKEPGKKILTIMEDVNVVVMKVVDLIILISPVGVFCLMAKVFSEQGLVAILPLAKYFFTVMAVLLFHMFFVYGALLKVIGRLNPVILFKKFYEVMVFAFSTSSSNATIPVSMEAAEEKLGVKRSVSSFVIPLGATINMDGTAVMQGVATVFVAEAYGIDLGLSQYLMVIFTATLASIGTAGVPAVGLIMLSMVFSQVGLPVEGIGIIMAVDRLLDMTRTVVNVTGDATVSCLVAKSEGQLDEELYNKKL